MDGSSLVAVLIEALKVLIERLHKKGDQKTKANESIRTRAHNEMIDAVKLFDQYLTMRMFYLTDGPEDRRVSADMLLTQATSLMTLVSEGFEGAFSADTLENLREQLTEMESISEPEKPTDPANRAKVRDTTARKRKCVQEMMRIITSSLYE